jgi:cyclophilin family peptidyl-prolyl cis-trans isomerase
MKNFLLVFGLAFVVILGLYFVLNSNQPIVENYANNLATTTGQANNVQTSDLQNNDNNVESQVQNNLATETNNLTTNTKEINKNMNNFENKDTIKVMMKTNMGDVVLELNNKEIPITAQNFAKLAESGFYNGIKFHRVIKGFMIQAGDPFTKDDSKQDYWGQGGPGYKFADEKSGLSNAPMTISMANSGPNTNGSQFFINTGNNLFLDGKHTVFGKVVSGMDVVKKIEGVKTLYPGQLDRPESPVVINSISVE